MTDRIWALIIFIAGGTWIYGGWKLWQDEREDAMFDALGPDRYLILLGGVLVLCALIIALGRSKAHHAGEAADSEPFVGPPLTFTILLILYSFAIMITGYTLGTLLFFIAAYFLAGRRNIGRTVVASLITTASFYVLFVRLADMNLPGGLVGF